MLAGAAQAASTTVNNTATATQPAVRLNMTPTTTTAAPTTTVGNPVPAGAFYVAVNGNDSTGTGTSAAPWRTFAHAFRSMRSGDTLVVRAGVYSESIGEGYQPPSGSAGRATRIVAEVDGAVTVDGAGLRIPLVLTSSFVRLEGFRFVSGASNVAALSGDHLQVLRSGFGNAGPGEHDSILAVEGADVLVEDSWMWGRGRSGIEVSGPRTTLRRNVIRLDTYAGPFEFVGVLLYGASDALVENVIALDFGTTTTTFDWKGGFRSRDMFDTRTQRFFGTIALNIPYDGYRASDTNYQNVVAWDVAGRGGIYEDSYKPGYTIDHATVGDVSTGGINTNLTAVTNSLFVRATGANTGGDRNQFFATPVPSGATNASTADPGLRYLLRREVGSPAAERGATIVNRYEDGVLTSTPLWPWPNEARIQQDFQTDFGLAGVDPTRGFADNTVRLNGLPTTLTSYIWEYLGSPCPTNVCP
jgi:Protein of unknown function (DUF1565)